MHAYPDWEKNGSRLDDPNLPPEYTDSNSDSAIWNEDPEAFISRRSMKGKMQEDVDEDFEDVLIGEIDAGSDEDK